MRRNEKNVSGNSLGLLKFVLSFVDWGWFFESGVIVVRCKNALKLYQYRTTK